MIFFYFAEIRYRFFYCVIGFLISFLSSYFYSLELLYLFARPFLHSNHHQVFFEKGFIFTNLTEAFHTTLKICFIWSLVFLLPVFFYQFWCFFAPSWYFFERIQYRIILLSAILLALLGGFTFYFLVLPELLDFLLNFKVNSPLFTIQLEARIDSYVRISSGVFLIVESVFQTPLFFCFLYVYGYVNSAFLSSNRKIFVLFFIFLSALFSPPDPITQLGLFLFFWFFFELFIWIGFLQWKNRCKE